MSTMQQAILANENFSGFVHMKDIGVNLPDLPKAVMEQLVLPVSGVGSDVPVDENYVFQKEHMSFIQQWLLGNGKNLLITGGTGSGKTTLIEQLSARLEWPLYDVAAHGALDIEDLLQYRGLKDGETVWEDGLALQAMKNGGILLLDEGNSAAPEQLIGLHKLLDHRGFADKNGNRIMPHPNFRIVMIGNAIDGAKAGAYAGINRNMNIATKNRFHFCLKVDYLDEASETALLKANYPMVSDSFIRLIVEFASSTRMAHMSDELPEPVSTRKAMQFAQMCAVLVPNSPEALEKVIKAIYVNMQPVAFQESIMQSFNRIVSLYTFASE